MTALTVIEVAHPDEYAAVEYGEHGETVGYKADPDKLPGPQYVEALDRVLAAVDEAMCDLTVLVDDASGQLCSASVGWVLHEDDEHPHRGGLRWATTYLVGLPDGTVAVVCEDDAPENLYAAAALGAATERERAATVAPPTPTVDP